MQMQNSELDSVFDSYVFNGLRIFGDPAFQKKVWIEKKGPEIGDFEDDIGFIFQYSESLLGKYDELSADRQKYLKHIKILYEMIEKFYHNSFQKHPNNKIENYIQDPEWKEIQKFANVLYCEIKKESWWKL